MERVDGKMEGSIDGEVEKMREQRGTGFVVRLCSAVVGAQLNSTMAIIRIKRGKTTLFASCCKNSLHFSLLDLLQMMRFLCQVYCVVAKSRTV